LTLIKMYFAGPLFWESERNWIRATISRIKALAAELNAPVETVWPFELFSPGELDALGDRAQHEVFIHCREHVHAADMLIALLRCCAVALLDGPQVDDGTAWEMGYFYAVRPEGALIVGIRTDGRRAGEFKNSLVDAMVECSCDRIAISVA